MLLVNHALARGTPAVFVIFVVSRGSSSKALVLLVRIQIRHFRHFRQKPPFSGGTKARFTKSTVFGTPSLRGVWPPFLEVGRNRPKSAFFFHFRPFLDAGKGPFSFRYPLICLNPHLLNPPFAGTQNHSRV